VRYEAKPEGEPLPDGRLPAFNGGFNHVRRRVPRDEFIRRMNQPRGEG
jgi:hypothetical protein